MKKLFNYLLVATSWLTLTQSALAAPNQVSEWVNQSIVNQETSVQTTVSESGAMSETSSSTDTFVDIPEDERVNHEAIYPKSYSSNNQPPKFEHPRGEKLGYQPNTLRLKDHVFTFVDMSGSTGYGQDFDTMMAHLDADEVVRVGKNKMNAFFGHYYDLSGNGVFNVIVDDNLIEVGSIAVITDKDGYSKGYEFTQILEILNSEQEFHYYDGKQIGQLVYNGNKKDMLFLQYCRWDISLGLLKGNVAYRVW